MHWMRGRTIRRSCVIANNAITKAARVRVRRPSHRRHPRASRAARACFRSKNRRFGVTISRASRLKS